MWRRAVITGLLAVNFLTVMSLLPNRVSAAQAEYCSASGVTFLNLPTWYKYVYTWDAAASECRINLRRPGETTVSATVVSLILLAVFEILLRIGGMASVVFVVYGGFRYIIARGESDQARAARTTIQNALIGLTITLFASAIINLIARNI